MLSSPSRLVLPRRAALLAAGATLAAAALPGAGPLAAAEEEDPVFRDRTFDIYRKGSHIGTHAVRFEEAGGRRRVTHELDLAVKIAFVTAFRYHQVARDSWHDAVMVGTRVETNDDGDKFRVVCEADGGKLAVDGPKGGYRTDLGVMTDLSFWNEAITRQTNLIDSKDGELIDVRTDASVPDTVAIGGQRVPARRYQMSGTRKRSGVVWYDERGVWIKAQVVTRGEVLDYRLAT